MKQISDTTKEEKKLKWWQLSLLGVAGTIGTYVVFDALASMTAQQPERGSFRSYAKKAFGDWAGELDHCILW